MSETAEPLPINHFLEPPRSARCGEVVARYIEQPNGEKVYMNLEIRPTAEPITADQLQRIAAIVEEKLCLHCLKRGEYVRATHVWKLAYVNEPVCANCYGKAYDPEAAR